MDWKTVIQMNLVIFELELIRSEQDPDNTEKSHQQDYENNPNDEMRKTDIYAKTDMSTAAEAAHANGEF